MKKKARVIAFYLPQFHPIPENDQWWGKGFTEWTNVTKAKPLFKGHNQPKYPADLGYYDLRLPEVREAQSKMAQEHGVEGFCYWHYWFGNGKRILERPFNDIVKSKEPSLPFCLAWANTSWKGTWYGGGDQMLFEQTYPGKEDYEKHFYALLPAFEDDRYIRVNGKLFFTVMLPNAVADFDVFVDVWQNLAAKHGLGEFYFNGFMPGDKSLKKGLSSALNFGGSPRNIVDEVAHSFKHSILNRPSIRAFLKRPKIVDYQRFIDTALPDTNPFDYVNFPVIYANWDNSARSKTDAVVFTGFSVEKFGGYIKKALSFIKDNSDEEKIIFVKSWNEWAEGNYLEPDREHGMGMLEKLKEEIVY